MVTRKGGKKPPSGTAAARASSPVDELLSAAVERGDGSLETGRYLVTYKKGAAEQGPQTLSKKGMRVADAREYTMQAAAAESVGDADALWFPEIGVALVGGEAAQERGMSAKAAASDNSVESIDPEYFVFAQGSPSESLPGFSETTLENATSEYLRGFLSAAEAIARDLRRDVTPPQVEGAEKASEADATWGLNACRVLQSAQSGADIKVAVLDSGVDMGHPDLVGRLSAARTQSFVGQPVQDLHGHGTHCIGTACGPQSPGESKPRYGIGFQSTILAGKVLSNSGSSVGSSVLAGINWAIANGCQVISMSLGTPVGVQPYYTAAGQAALSRGLLIIAAAGNIGSNTDAPANSPTIMSVAWLNPNLSPNPFSNLGKIDIAGPGQDVFSTLPMPRRYGVLSGTSMATPHVAGCAALWAGSSPSLRGPSLWMKLQATARRLPFPGIRVGAGLVQAP